MPMSDDVDQLGAATFASAPAFAQQAAAASAQGQPQGQGNGTWGFFSGQSHMGGITRTGTHEALNKAYNAMTESLKSINNDVFDIRLIKVDRTHFTKLDMSSIVTCLINKSDPTRSVFFHTLLIEGSVPPLDSLQGSFQGIQYPIRQYASDCMNEIYLSVVQSVVQGAYPQSKINDTSAQVAYRNFNWEDVEAVRTLTVNVLLPCVAASAKKHPNYPKLNLAHWNKDAAMRVRVNLNDKDGHVNYVGRPIHSPIVLTMSAESRPNNQNKAIRNSSEGNVLVTTAMGFNDLQWYPMDEQAAMAANPALAFMPPGQIKLPKYAVRFIATALECHTHPSIAGNLLALATTVHLRERRIWSSYYAPQPTQKGAKSKLNLRDIGALTLESNIIPNDPRPHGPRTLTNTPEFTPQVMYQYLAQLVRDDFSIAIDVDEYGSNTAQLEIFSSAAAGNEVAQRALIEAANQLTNNMFSKYYNGTKFMVENLDRVHLTVYTDSEGNKVDGRDHDHLAMLNISGDNDPKIGEQWSETFLQTQYPLDMQLNSREEMLRNVRANMEFYGMARRCTVIGPALAALDRACRDCGLIPELVNPNMNGQAFIQRGVASYLAEAGLGNYQGGMYNNQTAHYTAGMNQQAGYGQGYRTNWF